MIKKYLIKIKGGKLVIIKIEITGAKISSFQLLGDFFLYPEEKINKIEEALIGLKQSQLKEALAKVITKEQITLLGFDENDIIALIDQAFTDAAYESQTTR